MPDKPHLDTASRVWEALSTYFGRRPTAIIGFGIGTLIFLGGLGYNASSASSTSEANRPIVNTCVDTIMTASRPN